MNLTRFHLLAACAASTFVATAAQAQIVLPQVELRGAGATSVGDATVRTLNCVGNPGAGLNQYGTNSGQLSTIPAGNYAPTTPSTSNPVLDCAAQEIQPQFEGKYIGTGSGLGRQMWRTFTTANLNGNPGNINPFTGGAGVPSGWANLQFGLSEVPASPSDLTDYANNANSAANKAGAAIQFPLFVIPIAFAYNPAYGTKTTGAGTVELNFNVKVPGKINNVVAGGLKLSRSAYCKIFNGEITNWNDPAIKTLNSNVALFDTTDDTLARWNAEGAPIRLVGRADRSGGTEVFTRALAAQCGGLVTTNKFAKGAESLPYDNTSTIDIRRLRPDTRYFPTSSASNFSGTVQSLGGLVFDRVSDNICLWSEVNASTAQCDASLAPGGVFTNAATPGLFLVADGSSGVAEAIQIATGNALLDSTTTGIKLNGKFGYVGADFVAPVPGRALHSAALQKALTTAYVMPSAQNATAAFGTVLPPQTTAASGAFNTADTRQLGQNDPYAVISGSNPAVPVSRNNPAHWGAVIYNPNVPVNQTLAAPANGYPVTGASFFLTYTCFKPANAAVPGNNAKRFGVAEYVGALFGKVTKKSDNTALNANTFKGVGATSLGILTQSNTIVPSAAWTAAIWETFFKKSTQASNGVVLGNQNLWIQDNLPTTLSDVDNSVQGTDQKSNPGCDANFGA